jgi:DNA-binding NarL/FixJ family response regulator
VSLSACQLAERLPRAGTNQRATANAPSTQRQPRRLRSWFAASPSPVRHLPFRELSPREREILDHLAAGLSNAEIGERLHLSAKTVANHVSGLLNKLHVTQRGEAIVRAREAGLGREPQ